MPPSRHSSSSHTSSSHSSSSRSSSSRSYSSRSSSRSSYSSGPSRHSSSSRSSRPISSGSSLRSSAPGRPVSKTVSPHRPRVNQPLGYLIAGALSPKYYYGTRHEYVYYPESWTDQDSGTYYEKGYYDEAGKHYDNVSFAKNGKYENVVCHCEYCDQDIILNLDANQETTTNLKCPNCTAPLTIRSELDDYAEPAPADYEAVSTVASGTRKKKKKRRWLIIGIILLTLWIIGSAEESSSPGGSSAQGQQIQQIGTGNTGSWFHGDTSELRLTKSGENRYTQTDTADADKVLTWDTTADSYYDEASECWVWYNTDVEPPQWQYWYEGISSDYGDYGWMEHDQSSWYIEASESNWIPLPSKYDDGSLWYLAD